MNFNDYKECKVCKETKNIVNFRFRKSSGKYSGTCKFCEKEQRSKHELNLDLKNDSKKCIICGEEKDLSKFSFFKSESRFSSYCKTCDSLRSKNRRNSMIKKSKQENKEIYKKNRASFILRDYKKFDHNKNLKNDLTKKYIEESLKKNCVYCGHPSTGLDRINNSLGHLQSNCAPCCKECNIARMDNFTYQEMLIIGKAINQIKNNRTCQI